MIDYDQIHARYSARYPHFVAVPHYLFRMFKGELPRPEEVLHPGASWPTPTKRDPACRTFGFTTTSLLAAFKEKYGL